MLFKSMLAKMVHHGTIRLVDAEGKTETCGTGEEPSCTIRLHRKSLEWSLALNPALRVPEAYMEGTLTVDEDLRHVLHIIFSNYGSLESQALFQATNQFLRQTRRLKQFNPVGKAQKNVAHHYDLSGELYDYFLDSDRQYSCAYFTDPDNSLEQAQEDKKRHIASKMLLNEPGLKVLDIGSGWGGMGLYLSKIANCDVTGVTLSVEQHSLSEKRAAEAGLQNRCHFRLDDYRNVEGPFDRIVSVGMFEHVGKGNYHEFFAKVRDLLDDNGVCLLHTIGRLDQPAPINPFIRKYIFPGADLPSLSEATNVIEQSGLITTDIEILRLHYAETLRHWYERFQKHRKDVARIYDERFCRMWEMYLAGCEMGFRYEGLAVFQIQLAKNLEAVPLTRDYMYEWENNTRSVGMRAAE
ncbi:class I SAM-dependent methyltransferase [Fodinicurvata halophila]|uniref:Class I SAM-dependent methyltransferase n=1 Tax=Fodinicurvata halophila TaxID=1419723 RepID=A0ABV8ULQ2_9PROT